MSRAQLIAGFLGYVQEPVAEATSKLSIADDTEEGAGNSKAPTETGPDGEINPVLAEEQPPATSTQDIDSSAPESVPAEKATGA